MREKLKDRKLQVWLGSDEFNSLQEYAKKNYLRISELIRGWVHKLKEEHEIKEPSLPKQESKRGGK